MKRILTLLLLTFCVMTSFAKDIHTVVLTVNPQMHCASCENKITENLRYVKGVKSIQASTAKQTITVVIDEDKVKPAALVSSLKKIGYTATVKSDTRNEPAGKPVQPKQKAAKAKVDATTGATAKN